MYACHAAQPTRNYGEHVANGRTRTSRAPRRQPSAADQAGTGTRMFALTVPGLARLVGRELESAFGVVITDTGFDGRADVVLFDVPRGSSPDVLRLRTAEDVFVEVGRTLRADGDNPRWIATRVWRPERVQRALSIWANYVRRLSGSMTYRVIARVLQERSFLRTELRRQLTRMIGEDRPKWKVADPAQVEVWATEYAAGRIVVGLRLSTSAMRQRDGRNVERQGALRPAVAAAMVLLAGEPAGELLDPCCGSGTILREAQAEGWSARGIDIDPNAVQIARENASGTVVVQGDARSIDLPDGSVAACVSNLPFGEQFTVPGDPDVWLHSVLAEMSRVTRSGGRVVVLCPNVPRKSVPPQLTLTDRIPVRLLGLRSTIWSYQRG